MIQCKLCCHNCSYQKINIELANGLSLGLRPVLLFSTDWTDWIKNISHISSKADMEKENSSIIQRFEPETKIKRVNLKRKIEKINKF